MFETTNQMMTTKMAIFPLEARKIQLDQRFETQTTRRRGAQLRFMGIAMAKTTIIGI